MATTFEDADLERRLTKKYGPDCYGLKIHHQELERMARDIRATDQAAKQEQKRLLQTARRTYERLGHGSLQGLHLRMARGTVDADALRGLDDVAQSMKAEFPEHFAGHPDPEQRLFELLAQGNPAPLSYEEAMAQAAEVCLGPAEQQMHALGQRWGSGESIAALAREFGAMSWNKLWVELTNLGYAKNGPARV
jgi:hypothetical protein